MIDVALLAAGMWQIQPDITNAGLGDGDHDSARRTATSSGTRCG